MKKILIISLACPILFSCSSITEKVQESAAEKMAESILGHDIDVGNLNVPTDNKIISELKAGGEPLLRNVDDYKGSVNIAGENIVISVAGESEEEKLVITLSGEGLFNQKPYEGNAILEGADTQRQAMMIFSSFGSDGNITGFMLANGNVKITSFSENEVIISVNGHAASPMDLAAGKNLKEITGTITLIKPIMQAHEQEISEVVY